MIKTNEIRRRKGYFPWREKLWEKGGYKARVEHAMRKVNKWSMIRVWRWRRAGWWWSTRLIKNTKSSRKLIVLQVRCGIPENAVCAVETGVNWWLEKSDHCRWSNWSRALGCDEIPQVTWRKRPEQLIRRGNIFAFSAFLYVERLQGSENMVSALEDMHSIVQDY